MAFRIPFNEHLVIEADTPADVRALIEEFGVTLGPRRALPPPIVGTEVVPTDRPTDHQQAPEGRAATGTSRGP